MSSLYYEVGVKSGVVRKRPHISGATRFDSYGDAYSYARKLAKEKASADFSANDNDRSARYVVLVERRTIDGREQEAAAVWMYDKNGAERLTFICKAR